MTSCILPAKEKPPSVGSDFSCFILTVDIAHCHTLCSLLEVLLGFGHTGHMLLLRLFPDYRALTRFLLEFVGEIQAIEGHPIC